MHARAILVRSLFAVSWIYSRFVRAIARFQRKFSANHAKSAYFQRKSRKVSVKVIIKLSLQASAVSVHRTAIVLLCYVDFISFLRYHGENKDSTLTKGVLMTDLGYKDLAPNDTIENG